MLRPLFLQFVVISGIGVFCAPDPCRGADLEAVERGLGEMVARGHLNLEEAHMMMRSLRHSTKQGVYERQAKVQEIARKIRMAVAEGNLSEEEAKTKMEAVRRHMGVGPHGEGARIRQRDGAAMREHLREMEFEPGALRDAMRALREAGIEKEKMRQAMGATMRLVHGLRKAGDEFEGHERVTHFLENEVGLSADQVHTLFGLAERLAASSEADDHSSSEQEDDPESDEGER